MQLVSRFIPKQALLVTLLAISAALAGCEDPQYDQSSPQALFTSAKQMVADGNAHHLDDLIYTDKEEMRPVLDRLGSVLGHLQELAVAVDEAFPDEVAALKAEAEQAAKEGKASSYLTSLLTGRQNSRRPPRERERAIQAEFNRTLKQLAADPFGWLEQSEDRIDFIWVADDTRSITWDGQILFPPWGLLIKKRDGKWYLALPTDHPVVADNLPTSEEFWQIAPEIVQILDNTIIDMIEDVERGRVQELSLMAEEAGKKLVPMAAIGFFAMGKVMEAERREKRDLEKQERERRERERAQSKTESQTGDDLEQEPPPTEGG